MSNGKLEGPTAASIIRVARRELLSLSSYEAYAAIIKKEAG